MQGKFKMLKSLKLSFYCNKDSFLFEKFLYNGFSGEVKIKMDTGSVWKRICSSIFIEFVGKYNHYSGERKTDFLITLKWIHLFVFSLKFLVLIKGTQNSNEYYEKIVFFFYFQYFSGFENSMY